MSLDLKICKFALLLKNVPYKYRVYTPFTTSAAVDGAPWEMIYSTLSDIPSDYANRVLAISSLDCRTSMDLIYIYIHTHTHTHAHTYGSL